jgi:predicted  nucleic acid-binding Zn-ribbon protein
MGGVGSGGRLARPGSAPVRREKSLPPPEFSVRFGGWKQRLAQVDAQRSSPQLGGRASPTGSLASVDEREGSSGMVTRSRSMLASSSDRPGSAERAWKPRMAEEWSQSLVGKQRFRSNWLRCVGAYRDLQQEFPDLVLPLGTPPTPGALAAHLRLFDMLIALAKEAGDVPGCNQDEHNMLCAIRTTCLAALYVPPESAKAQQALRPELNVDHSHYDERQMCCSRTSVLEAQITEAAEERNTARQRIVELEAALDQEMVERARLQSKVSALEASTIILEKAIKEGELEINAQSHQIRRLEAVIEDTSESARLRRMRRELEEAKERVKRAVEIESSSLGRINQAEDCVAEMQGMVTEGNAERTVLRAALAAAEESSADLRSHVETLTRGLDRASKREVSNSQELATLRSYYEESEAQRQELTPRPVRPIEESRARFAVSHRCT